MKTGRSLLQPLASMAALTSSRSPSSRCSCGSEP